LVRVCCDIEADSLTPTKIYCISTKDIDSGNSKTYTEEDFKEFQEFSKTVDTWIGHNFIQFDAPAIRNLLGCVIHPDSIVDTLVLSRLLNFKIEGGHSLEAWGQRLKFPKGNFSDWSRLTPEMIKYCEQDVELTHRVYLACMKHLDREEFNDAISIEHYIATSCYEMQRDGFRFDRDAAVELLNRTCADISAIDRSLVQLPPKARFVREYNPRVTKHGTISLTSIPRGWKDITSLDVDSPFSVVKWEPFDPNSNKQVVERLNDAGWKPTDKTAGHIEAAKEKDKERLAGFKIFGWKVNETNLSTLPDTAPEGIRALVKRLLLEGRRRTLQEWVENYNDTTGCVHANFNGIGTWTHRMSHTKPNLGNVAAIKSIKYKSEELSKLAIEYGSNMRGLWGVHDGNHLVGTDAEGIQLRIFAHYINDPVFTESLINGRKEDGTDPHSINGNILDCPRDDSKTFIYAFLLGAGDAKVGQILKRSTREGAVAKARFIESYPGLAALKREAIPRDAIRGFFQGFDGRLVRCDSEHLMLAGYLQNGEACIMKHALRLWKSILDKENIKYKLVNFVHDEWQTEVWGGLDVAEFVASTQRDAIRIVGEQFNLRCPFSGSSAIGQNWRDTH